MSGSPRGGAPRVRPDLEVDNGFDAKRLSPRRRRVECDVTGPRGGGRHKRSGPDDFGSDRHDGHRRPPENAFEYRRNWGRWGADDQMGAVNLITPAKRAAAAGLVKSGRTVSLSRPFQPDQHFIRINDRGTGRSVVDYYGFLYHGVTVTHVDALCHMWDQNGMWNGRDPAREIDTNGARFADITAFGSGLITRGVLLDVPRHRRKLARDAGPAG